MRRFTGDKAIPPAVAGGREKTPMRVFIMDTWAYPYRLPVFEKLHEQVEIETFFSRPKPHRHLDRVSFERCSFKCRSGKWLLALIPVHLLWEKYDVYMVGQIGVESVAGAFFTLLVSILRKKPLVLWTDYIETENYREKKRIKRFFGDFIRKSFVRHCAAAMGFGGYTENYLKKIAPPGLRIFNVVQVVPEVCNVSAETTPEKKDYKDKVVLLYLSYLRESKGGDLLIRAFKGMNRTDAVLIIAGSGEKEREWKDLAGDSPFIRFIGYVEGAGKANCYSQADVFVFPTEHDTWGLVVNEAMYHGLPIVVTSAAGAAELVIDNGIIVEPRNDRMMQEALTQLIENPALRKEMGERSKARIGRYGTEYAADSFMRVIRCVHEPNGG